MLPVYGVGGGSRYGDRASTTSFLAGHYWAVNAEDPLAFKAGDANLRRYVGNDRVNLTDPSGEFNLSGLFAGGTAGTVTGAWAGSVIGTPGVGTVGGGTIGFISGFIYGGYFSDSLGDAIGGGAVLGLFAESFAVNVVFADGAYATYILHILRGTVPLAAAGSAIATSIASLRGQLANAVDDLQLERKSGRILCQRQCNGKLLKCPHC